MQKQLSFQKQQSLTPFDPKERAENLSLSSDEKRKLYKCGNNFVGVQSISPFIPIPEDRAKRPPGSRVSLWKGDITRLEIDAIVNAANNSLLGGGGVDGAIHSAAGKLLLRECATLNGCDTGMAKITAGYNLPAKYVIHTVGPVGEKQTLLETAYSSCLRLIQEYNLTTIAFPCISTGIYGYPNEKACEVALSTVKNFLTTTPYGPNVERVIFCLFLDKDVECYNRLIKKYFS